MSSLAGSYCLGERSRTVACALFSDAAALLGTGVVSVPRCGVDSKPFLVAWC